MMDASSLLKKELYAYALLALPIAFIGIPLYMFAPDYYATEFGVSLTDIGLSLLILRIVDAFQDPLIGHLSDIYAKYRPLIMLAGSLLLVMSFILLFQPMTDSYLLWFTVFIFLSTSSFSLLTINLNSLGGMWSKDHHQKTTIATTREAFGLVGLIFAVSLPTILQQSMEKSQSFLVMGLLLLVIMIIAHFVFYMGWQRHHRSLDIRTKNTAIFKLFSFKKIQALSSSTKQFYLIYSISMLASSIPGVLVLFFIRDYLQLEDQTGILLLSYFLSGAMSMIGWNVLSKKTGKHCAWLIAMALAIASFIWAYFLTPNDLIPYLIICITTGMAFGAELSLPPSILADHIQQSDNSSQASFYYGILALIAKLALAISAAITLPLLETSGFQTKQENSEQALHLLVICYSLIPCIIKILAVWILWRNKRNALST